MKNVDSIDQRSDCILCSVQSDPDLHCPKKLLTFVVTCKERVTTILTLYLIRQFCALPI